MSRPMLGALKYVSLNTTNVMRRVTSVQFCCQLPKYLSIVTVRFWLIGLVIDATSTGGLVVVCQGACVEHRKYRGRLAQHTK